VVLDDARERHREKTHHRLDELWQNGVLPGLELLIGTTEANSLDLG
jgi:hypothetical protein